MSILLSPIPRPKTMWDVREDFHELLFSKWVFAAHAKGIRLDFHLPICNGSQVQLREALTATALALSAEIDVEGLTATELPNEGAKWKAFSALQKAIRRGDFLNAWRPCHALMKAPGQDKQMWRRLVVTAMEDVGLGDPYAVAFTCLIAGNTKLRAQMGENRALAFVLKHLCEAPKSRDLCDVVVYCFLRKNLDNLFAESLDLSLEDLMEIALNPKLRFSDRLVAHFRLYGPKWPHVSKVGNPASGADAETRKGFMEATGIPPLFVYLTVESHRRSGEALGLPVPFLWQLMTASPKAWTAPDPFENGDDTMLQGVYAATFDKHTWQGKAALKRFYNGNSEIHDFLSKHCMGTPLPALERAVFYTEGALLRPRLFYVGAEDLFWEVLDAKLAANGFPSREVGLEFYDIVQSNLHELHKHRVPS